MKQIIIITTNSALESKINQIAESANMVCICYDSIALAIENKTIVSPDVIIIDRLLLKNQISAYVKLLYDEYVEIPQILFLKSRSEAEIIEAFRAGVYDIIYIDSSSINISTILSRAFHKRKEFQGVKQHIEQLRLFNNNLQVKITELRKEIENTENFTESIMRGLGAGIITFDMSGKITYANPSAANIFGWSTENLIGIDMNTLMPIEANLGQIIDGSEFEKQYEVNAIGIDQKELKIGYTLFPRKNDRDDVIEMIVIFRDLFELEKIREENRRLDKIATLGQIAAGIAHEVKNPLAAIKSIVQAIAIDFNEEDEKRGQLQRISTEVDRINTLLENSFGFARNKKPYFVVGRITDVIHSVKQLLLADCEKKNITISVVEKNTIPKFKFEPNQINQVFLNLILNAIDAMDKGGEISIVINHQVLPRHIKGFVVIEVKDTGSGIESSDLKRIFDPFFTTKPHGTGLGLPITYKIIQDHMGKIEVESKFGKGTKFTIYLPD